MAFSFQKKLIQQGIACEMQSKFYSASNNKKRGLLKDVLVGGSHAGFYSDFIFRIYRAFDPWCEIFIKVCPAIAEILQLTDA